MSEATNRRFETRVAGRAIRLPDDPVRKERAVVRWVWLACVALGLAGEAAAQSLLERSPNLSGGWTGASGTLHFNFLHRFDASPAPARKVVNSPTFLLAAGLPGRVLVGAQYATNSQLVARYPNEWEFFGRWAPVGPASGLPVEVALHGGYNLAAESLDGEATVARAFGRSRVMLVARGFSDAFGGGEARWAAGGGATVGLTSWLALAGDVVTLLDERPGEKIGWSAGVHLAIPYTPHTLSLQAGNTNTTTLQGSARGAGPTTWGFEFTVPITLSRYVGRRAGGAGPQGAPGALAGGAGDTVVVAMRGLKFVPERLEVRPGTVVVWRNEDAVPHTATAADGSWDSGLLDPGGAWARRFDGAGTFAYTCTPHPFMQAVVVVR